MAKKPFDLYSRYTIKTLFWLGNSIVDLYSESTYTPDITVCTLRGLIFTNFAQIRKIKSSRKVCGWAIRENKSSRKMEKLLIRENKSLRKFHEFLFFFFLFFSFCFIYYTNVKFTIFTTPITVFFDGWSQHSSILLNNFRMSALEDWVFPVFFAFLVFVVILLCYSIIREYNPIGKTKE